MHYKNIKSLHLQVIFDGDANVVRWVVVTDGTQLPPDFALEKNFDLLLLRSSDGMIDATVVKNALIVIDRYV